MKEHPSFLAFGDVHLGTYKYPIHTYQREALRHIVTLVRELRVGIVLFTGDAFRIRVPSASEVSFFGEILADIAKLAPIYMVRGNHDIVGNVSTIDVYSEYQNVYGGGGWIDRSTFPWGTITSIPWMTPKALESTGDLSAQKSSTTTIAETAISTTSLNLNKSKFNVLLAHCSTLGSAMTDESSATMGNDVLWKPSWFEPFDFCALGHLHKAQRVAQTNAYYTGSVCPTSFNESSSFLVPGVAKGVLYCAENSDHPEWILFPPEISPHFVTTEISLMDRDVEFLPTYPLFLQIVKAADEADPLNVPPCVWYEIVSVPQEKRARIRTETNIAGLSTRAAIAEYLSINGWSDLERDIFAMVDEYEKQKGQ